MALKAGRVGVRPDQVDVHGRLLATDYLVDQLRELLESNEAELSALRLAREELAQLHLDEPIIQKPVITPIEEPVFEEETEEVDNGTESE